MAARSRCQGWSLPARGRSLMAGLLSAVGLVKPGEQLPQQGAELLLAWGGQTRPQRRRRRDLQGAGRFQARGGMGLAAVVDMRRFLRVSILRDVAGTRRPVQAAFRLGL